MELIIFKNDDWEYKLVLEEEQWERGVITGDAHLRRLIADPRVESINFYECKLGDLPGDWDKILEDAVSTPEG